MSAVGSLCLKKCEKLCSPTDIDTLFANGEGTQAFIAFPLRVVWRVNTNRRSADDTTTKILVSIPKRRIRHAVDRVRMRRLVRECYRLGRHNLEGTEQLPLEVAFIYVDSIRRPYADIEHAMTKALTRIRLAATT